MATPRVSPSRTVKVYKLFTADGIAVNLADRTGRRFTLDTKDSNGNAMKQAHATETLFGWPEQQLARAEHQIGLRCEWRQTGTTEVMDVAF